MSKSTFFTGQPIFSQLLFYVSRSKVLSLATSEKADRYCKKFDTYNHLVTILYAIFNRCTSLREVTTGMLAWEHRLAHLGLQHHPRRSTISDANSRRNSAVFEAIYNHLYQKYRSFLPDSRSSKQTSKLYIADSTTISLFNEVLRNAGRSPVNGKRKGGIKVHTLMRSDEDVPSLIRFSSGAAHDTPFLKNIKLAPGSILVFDRGYNDYMQFQRFDQEKISWITRLRKNTVYTVLQKETISQYQLSKGVTKDYRVELGHHHSKKNLRVKARLIFYRDPVSGEKFHFLTNNNAFSPATIAGIYRKRWQIEILFKRIKQNYPLKSFLGESENAIKIQIWCALIADLILKLIKANTTKNWSFANLAAMIRLHLMTYIDIFAFLKNPEKALRKIPPCQQLKIALFPT